MTARTTRQVAGKGLAALLLVFGGGMVMAPTASAQGPDEEPAAGASGTVEPADFAPGDFSDICNWGVIADTYDHEPRVYGGGWVNCDFAGYMHMHVTLKRSGEVVGEDLCSVEPGHSCDAAANVYDPSGMQYWEACNHIRYYQAGYTGDVTVCDHIWS